MSTQVTIQSIGVIRSEFPEKFGVPKQSGLAPLLQARLELAPEWGHETALRGLVDCTHLWVIFYFHLNSNKTGLTVRPPILGGKERMGIFATRSPHRPNPLGLSLVKLERIERHSLIVSGHDFVDGTPLIDIKPYVSRYDRPLEDSHHWAEAQPPQFLEVIWQEDALKELARINRSAEMVVLEQVLRLDPRPRSVKAEASFGMSFAGLNLNFEVQGSALVVKTVTLASRG